MISFMGFVIGGFDMVFYSLLVLILFDFISGILCSAFYEKNISSEIFYKGGIKKILIIIMVAVANIIDTSLELKIGLRAIVLGYYIANECLSIFENCIKMGLPVPEAICSVLEQIKNKKSDIN